MLERNKTDAFEFWCVWPYSDSVLFGRDWDCGTHFVILRALSCDSENRRIAGQNIYRSATKNDVIVRQRWRFHFGNGSAILHFMRFPKRLKKSKNTRKKIQKWLVNSRNWQETIKISENKVTAKKIQKRNQICKTCFQNMVAVET